MSKAALMDRFLHWMERTTRTWRMARFASIHQKGIGERIFSRMLTGGSTYGWPGGWSQDRIEMALHYKHWSFVAIRAIAQEVGGLTPNVAKVRTDVAPVSSTQTYRDARRFQAKSLQRLNRFERSLHTIKPHEEIEPVACDHPLMKLFCEPNSTDVAWDLWYELILFLQLTGNSYLWCPPSRLGLPVQLWVIPAHWVWPRIKTKWGQERGYQDPDPDSMIDYYEIRPWIGPGTLHFPANEIIHFRYKNPIHKIDGWSPQSAGAEWIDVSESVDRSRFFGFKNGVFPIGSVELSEDFHDPDDAELDRIYAKFFARAQGEVNYGRPMILPPGAKYNPLQISPNEMAWVQSAEQMRDWVLSLFGVPKEIVGLQPSGSELSWYAPMNQFCRFTITPLLQYVGQVLTQRLAHRFDGSLRVWWDDPTPDNPTQTNSDIQVDIAGGAITPNEQRGIRGREPYQHGGDDPILPMGVSPMPLNTGQDLLADIPAPAQEEAQQAEAGQTQSPDVTRLFPVNRMTQWLKEDIGHPSRQAQRVIVLVRHGKTKLNAEDPSQDRIRGWADVPLNDTGREEAKCLAEYLRDTPLGRVISSDLKRTKETAEIIVKSQGKEIDQTTPDLRPWNVGDLTGELSSEVHPILEDYARNKPDEKIAGGESFNDFKNRLLPRVGEWMNDSSDDYPILLVTHFRDLKLVQSWVEAGATNPGAEAPVDMELMLQWKDMPTGVILRLIQDQNGAWSWDRIECAKKLDQAQQSDSSNGAKGSSDLLGDFPDVRQAESYSCGAAALKAVCQFFGVGPDDEQEFMDLLGTDPKDGTRVSEIVAGAKRLGLSVHAAEMDLKQLGKLTKRGTPVICPIQSKASPSDTWGGHYVVVTGTDKNSVYVQDPVAGPKRIGNNLWMERWWDKEADGTEYKNYGIAASMPSKRLRPSRNGKHLVKV